MSYSIKIVSDILDDKTSDLYEDLGFIITVIRDNTKDDNTYSYLNKLVHRLTDNKDMNERQTILQLSHVLGSDIGSKILEDKKR